MDFLVKLLIAIGLYFILLNSLEPKLSLRKKFQEKFITEENKIKVFALAFVVVVIGFSFASALVDTLLPKPGEIKVFVEGVKLGLLVYMINIINPYYQERNE